LTVDFGVPHGLANGLLLAPVFEYNAKYVPNKVAAIAEALGFPAESTPENAAGKVVAALHALFAELGASPAAKNAGVPADCLEDCAEQVCANRDRFKNQVGSPSLEDVTCFYRDAFEGTTA